MEWPRWNADIKEARIEGDLAPGTSFTWKAGPGTIRSAFREVDWPHVLAWTGKTMGITAIHVYRLEQADDRRESFLKSRGMASWRAFFASPSRRRSRRQLMTDCELKRPRLRHGLRTELMGRSGTDVLPSRPTGPQPSAQPGRTRRGADLNVVWSPSLVCRRFVTSRALALWDSHSSLTGSPRRILPSVNTSP
jgi:hypothetical protein